MEAPEIVIKERLGSSSFINCTRLCKLNSSDILLSVGSSSNVSYTDLEVKAWQVKNGVIDEWDEFSIDMSKELSQIMGNKVDNVGQVMASELIHCNDLNSDDQALQLCCLSTEGYLVTYRYIFLKGIIFLQFIIIIVFFS